MGHYCSKNSQVSDSSEFKSEINYSTTCLDLHQWLVKKYEFQIFTYKQIINDLHGENPNVFDEEMSASDRRFVKLLLKALLDVKLLKYYNDGYFTIPQPTLSFELAEENSEQFAQEKNVSFQLL